MQGCLTRTLIALAGTVLFLISQCSLGQSAATEKRVALVIGNSAYKNTTTLPNPRNDAQAIAAALRRVGFDVDIRLDVDKRAFDDALRRFGDRLDGASAAVFFYAGHGLQVDGRNYLLPVDARLEKVRDLTYETIDLSTVLREMDATRRINLVFLDACRDNPLSRSLANTMGTRSASVGRGLAPVDAATGTLISYATKDGSVAADGVGRNSPFTTALLSQIEQPGLEVGLMLRRVRENVIAATNNKQVPWEYGSLLGEFYFRPGRQVASAAPPTVATPATAAVQTVFPNSVEAIKPLELGEVVLLLMPEKSQKTVGWDHRADARIHWLSDGYQSEPKGISYFRNGLLRVHVMGKRSTVLKKNKLELAWTVHFSADSSPRFGPQEISLAPGTPDEMCFGTIYDGCSFDPHKSLAATGISSKKVCERMDSGNAVTGFELSHPSRKATFARLEYNYGSGGESAAFKLVLTSSASELCKK